MPLTPEQQAEIAAARADLAVTARATAPGIEPWLHQAIPVLDHGFIRIVDYMGDDAAIVQAARVSYGAGCHGEGGAGGGDFGLLFGRERHMLGLGSRAVRDSSPPYLALERKADAI